MWTYSQSTGVLSDGDGRTWQCYAGSGDGKNNPADEAIPDVGPLPRGVYLASGPQTRTKTGPVSIALIPAPGNEEFGRSAFYMHGDSVSHPGCASEGCIVAPLAARLAFVESHDDLTVTE